MFNSYILYRVDCVICGDRVRISTTFQAPCNHYYCPQCIQDLVQACLGDESLFPLRCCQQSLPMHDVLQMLTDVLHVQFEAKSREYETLAHHRVYCSNPWCSKFLGSSETFPGMDMHCSRCFVSTCVLCKQSSHPRETCSENTALNELKALAEVEHWQTCPQCSSIIELNHGCYHMTCLCRMQFCYLCAVPWKRCSCPQWDEVRLLDTAAQRVEREVGVEVRAAEPVAFQRLVRQRASELRYRHDCDPHRWRHYQGAGTCEECGHYLPLFLKVRLYLDILAQVLMKGLQCRVAGTVISWFALGACATDSNHNKKHDDIVFESRLHPSPIIVYVNIR
jgi:hypothetical protein